MPYTLHVSCLASCFTQVSSCSSSIRLGVLLKPTDQRSYLTCRWFLNLQTSETGEGVFEKLKGSMDKARHVGSRVLPRFTQYNSRHAQVG